MKEHFFEGLQYCYQTIKDNILPYRPHLLSNNSFHMTGILVNLQLSGLTFWKHAALCSQWEINEVDFLAVLAGVTACPYCSYQAVNRQKPVTRLIKLKSSSCQTMCLALPSFGPNGCLRSMMSRCWVHCVSSGERCWIMGLCQIG